MQDTRHVQQRMSQRGITRDMVDFVLDHGTIEQDKFVINKKEARTLLEDLQRQERVLKKILDKGGVVVVAEGEALITTYNCTGRQH